MIEPRVWSKKEEDYALSRFIKDRHLSYSKLFDELANELNRTRKSIEHKFYNDIRPRIPKSESKSKVTNPKVKKVKVKKLSISKRKKFFWTDETVAMMKKELLTMIKNNRYVFKELINNMAKNMGCSTATMFKSIHAIKKKYKSTTIVDFYNSIVSGVIAKDLNKLSYSPSKRIKRKRKVAEIIAPTIKQDRVKTAKKEKIKPLLAQQEPEVVKEVIVQEVVEKPSFWHKINPFYRIKQKISKMESEIQEIKRKIK
jgi:hypothetical protein